MIEVEFDSASGEILSSQTEAMEGDEQRSLAALQSAHVSLIEAIETALAHTQGKAKGAELEEDDGSVFFEVELVNAGREYEVVIDLTHGTVLWPDHRSGIARCGQQIEVSLRALADAVEIVVADNSPGIPASAREQVLRRFYRLEAHRIQAGNGLGLSPVAAVAKRHRGRLELGDNGPRLRISLILPTML
jgi:K+-sensing histidine kinase KdpD